MKVEEILRERGQQYGDFSEQAALTRAMLEAAENSCNWHGLPADMTEAIHMIYSKIARILNGDPTVEDSWRDIAGYAQLVADRIESE